MSLTQLGGWWIDPDAIPRGSWMIDGGVSMDIRLATDLISLRDILVIGIDPSYESLKYVAEQRVPNYTFALGAVAGSGVSPTAKITMFCNREHGSDSSYDDHARVGRRTYATNCILLDNLVTVLSPSIIKLDIEGSEYEVYKHCVASSVVQILIEFHHRMISRFKKEDTDRAVQFFIDNGYKVSHKTDLDEYTFVRVRL